MKKVLSAPGFSIKTILPNFFGPGIVLALVVVTIFLARHTLFPERVQIERHLLQSNGDCLDHKPTAQFFLMKAKESGLTSTQVEKLENINQAKTRALVLVDLKIETASQRFSEFMKKHESGGLSVLQIQEAGQPLSAASLRKKSLSNEFDQQALNILDPEQRAIAMQLWRSAHTAGNGSESKPR